MTRDEQLAWLTAQAEGDADEAPAPDHLTAAAMRIVDHPGHGWWYDPPLNPETVLTMAELAQLPAWHVRDDSGRVWKLDPVDGACGECGHPHGPVDPDVGCPTGPPALQLVAIDETGAGA